MSKAFAVTKKYQTHCKDALHIDTFKTGTKCTLERSTKQIMKGQRDKHDEFIQTNMQTGKRKKSGQKYSFFNLKIYVKIKTYFMYFIKKRKF